MALSLATWPIVGRIGPIPLWLMVCLSIAVCIGALAPSLRSVLWLTLVYVTAVWLPRIVAVAVTSATVTALAVPAAVLLGVALVAVTLPAAVASAFIGVGLRRAVCARWGDARRR